MNEYCSLTNLRSRDKIERRSEVTAMRTVKQPDVRKQEILDGAIRVFAKNGYDRTTIAGIAKELNISQGLCYRYFPSKEDIYHAAIEKYADLILQASKIEL